MLVRNSTLRNKKGDGYEVKRVILAVDRSGFFQSSGEEAAALLQAGSIVPLRDRPAKPSEAEVHDTIRARSLARLAAQQKNRDSLHG